MLVVDPVKVGFFLDTLTELIGVETELPSHRNRAFGGVGISVWTVEVVIVEVPPGVLVAGAFGC